MKRFSLRALLILVTVVGLFLGYSQWRRQRMIRRCQWYASQGYFLDLPNDIRDWIWQRMPRHGRMSAYNYGVLFHGPKNEEMERVNAIGEQWMDEFPEATSSVDVIAKAKDEWWDKRESIMKP